MNRHKKKQTAPRQPFLFSMPEPERCGGTVEAYLLARPGWSERQSVAAACGITERELRSQAENSGGRIIFRSMREGGLKHTNHADDWEMRACASELEQRARTHLNRAAEIMALVAHREHN